MRRGGRRISPEEVGEDGPAQRVGPTEGTVDPRAQVGVLGVQRADRLDRREYRVEDVLDLLVISD